MGDVIGRLDGGGSRPARVNAASYVVDRPRDGARAPKSKRQMRWSAQKRPRFPSSKRTWCLLHATPNRSQKRVSPRDPGPGPTHSCGDRREVHAAPPAPRARAAPGAAARLCARRNVGSASKAKPMNHAPLLGLVDVHAYAGSLLTLRVSNKRPPSQAGAAGALPLPHEVLELLDERVVEALRLGLAQGARVGYFRD